MQSPLDPLLHQPIRTQLVAYIAGHGEPSFTDIKQALELTDGNLDAHLKKLLAADYVEKVKDDNDGRTQTLFMLTEKGRAAFERYVSALGNILSVTMKIGKNVLLAMLTSGLLYFGLAAPVKAQPTAEQLARQTVDQLVNLQNDEAEAILDRLDRAYPDYPLTGFYRAAAIWAQAQSKPELAASALQTLQQSEREAKAALETQPGNAQWQLALGMSQTFIARLYQQLGEWIKGWKALRAGRDNLRQLLQKHPDANDALFTLGLYETLTGSVPDGWRWLSRTIDLDGDPKKGLKYLRTAIVEAPVVAPEAARTLLNTTAPECGNRALAWQMRQTYPDNPDFSRALQVLDLHCGYPQQALQENQLARAQYLKQHPRFLDTLNYLRLQALADEGRVDAIKQSEKEYVLDANVTYFYLAQALDVAGKHSRARRLFKELSQSESADKALQREAGKYLHEPYVAPEPVKSLDNGLRLNQMAEIRS